MLIWRGSQISIQNSAFRIQTYLLLPSFPEPNVGEHDSGFGHRLAARGDRDEIRTRLHRRTATATAAPATPATAPAGSSGAATTAACCRHGVAVERPHH